MAANVGVLFGQVVRQYREKQGVSQEAFADRAGIHRTYVSSIERGKVQISIAIAQRVAEALEVPLSRIWRDVERAMAADEADEGK
jgi:transcriptional regulator with XRE-family HTH domain